MKHSARRRPAIRSWDIFCRVVDNYGDAAVCWRLARELIDRRAERVRLWIDRPEVLHALVPAVGPECAAQVVDGVAVSRWDARAEFGAPAEVAVDAFGCGLPDAYCAAIVERAPGTLWITLEYLSAERWVREHHGLPSPHPRLPIRRYFFFPGFSAGTGGLLKETALDRRRQRFQLNLARQARFWRSLGFPEPSPEGQLVSLFGYTNPAAPDLFETWARGDQPIVAAVPPGPLRGALCTWFGSPDPGDGRALRRGRLEARLLPFLSQRDYDHLLWTCALNFVRGEDSFVRAQWAARPMVWHAYPQQERAHALKLQAFLGLYCEGLDTEAAQALRAFWMAWNLPDESGGGGVSAAWESMRPWFGALTAHAAAWASRAEQGGNLAENLAEFCLERV